jgi:predicted RNA-binding Zn ribbon-like protein
VAASTGRPASTRMGAVAAGSQAETLNLPLRLPPASAGDVVTVSATVSTSSPETATTNNTDKVKLAYTAVADLAMELSVDGFTALHFAAFFAQPEAARLLNEIAEEAAAVPHLEHVDGTWKVRFGPSEPVAAHLGATAAAGLIDVVQAHGLTRFGTCSGPPCIGVFVDATKNRSKRYCCHWCADREAQRRHRARST